MNNKLTLIFAVVALFSIANAALTTSSFTTSSFNVTPVAVVNSSDTVFYNTLGGQSVDFGPGADNTTNYMYGVGATGSGPYSFIVTRRKLNATTQASLGDESLTGITCTANNDYASHAGGKGTYGATCTVVTNTNVNNLHLYTYTAASTSVKDTTLTAETATGNSFAVKALWYDSGLMIWYVLFTKNTATDIVSINLQAVNVSNGTNTLLYSTAGGVAVFTPAASTVIAKIDDITGGPNNVTNATTGSVGFWDNTGTTAVVKLIPVTLSTGAPGSVVTLATDPASTTYASGTTAGFSKNSRFIGLGNSYSTSIAGIFTTELNQPSAAGSTESTTKKIFIFYNGSSTSGENYTVANTITSAGIAGTHYGNGFTIFQILGTGSSPTSLQYQYINYFRNGSYNSSSTATTVGTFQGQTGMWLDSNGALWVGTANYELAASQTVGQGLISDASVGKLFGQVYLFANTLSSVFAFVALMVAALFAF